MAGDASFELFSGITVLGGGLTELVAETNPDDGFFFALTVSGLGSTGQVGDGSISLGPISCDGGGQGVSVVLGSIEVSAQGVSGSVGMSLDDDTATPAVYVLGQGITGRVGRGNVALNNLTVWANSHENLLELASITVESNGQVGQVGDAVIDSQPVSVVGSGLTQIIGRGVVRLYSVFATGQGIAESEGIGAISLKSLHVNANGIIGRVGAASIQIPAIDVDGAGVAKIVGSAGVSIYPLAVDGFGEVASVVPVFSSLSLNTRINAASTYTNFGYNSLCNFNNMTLMASEDGIFAFVGDTDNGDAIVSRMKSGITDVSSTQYKRISNAYIHGTMSSGLILSLITEDGEERKYRVSQANETVRVLKYLTGRGVYSRNWQWSLEGRFKVDQMTLEIDMLPRRIR